MGREYPANPLASCHALVHQGGRFLLVERARAPFAGCFGLPGGAVELGETVEAALVREVHEETGLWVRITRFLGYTDAITRDQEERVRLHYVIFFFEAEVTGGALVPGDDAEGAVWVSPAEARQYPLTDSVQWCLARAGR